MPRILESKTVDLSANTLWRKIGSFGAVGDWHPMLEKSTSDGETSGATRIAYAKDGSEQVERLQDYDDANRSYKYEMISTSLQVRNYVGELKVVDNRDGTSTALWSAQFEVTQDDDDEVIDMVTGFLKAGLESLEKQGSSRR